MLACNVSRATCKLLLIQFPLLALSRHITMVATVYLISILPTPSFRFNSLLLSLTNQQSFFYLALT